MTFMDLIPILMVSTFALFLVVERIAPARALPRVPRWLPKGLAFFVVVGALNAIIPALVMEGVGDFTVFHLQGLGVLGGALVMTLVSDFSATRSIAAFTPRRASGAGHINASQRGAHGHGGRRVLPSP